MKLVPRSDLRARSVVAVRRSWRRIAGEMVSFRTGAFMHAICHHNGIVAGSMYGPS